MHRPYEQYQDKCERSAGRIAALCCEKDTMGSDDHASCQLLLPAPEDIPYHGNGRMRKDADGFVLSTRISVSVSS